MTFRPTLRLRFGLLLTAGVLVAPACSGPAESSPEPACLAQAATGTCTPQYAPTYDNVFANTLAKHCGIGGCHAGPNPQGGLELDQKDAARANLLAADAAGDKRVIPGDTKCGKAIVRLETVGASYSMPPTGHLDNAELCSIAQWIAQGAQP
jgi:hypothetical protein